MAIKKGFFFSTDAILALFILVTAIFSVSLIYMQENPTEQVYFLSEDVANIMASTSIKDINNSYAKKLMKNGTIKDNSTPLLEQIGTLWASGNKEAAERLAKNITDAFEPEGHGISVVIDDEVLYSNNASPGEELISHKSLITGIEEGKPLNGTAARIYFSSMGRHKRDEFTYFGGFTGQGNITHTVELPTDFEQDNFINAEMKAEIPGDFYIYVNGDLCSGLQNGSKGKVNLWNISDCKSELRAGKNKVMLNFDSGFNESYIAGGYINIEYYTDTISDTQTNKTRYDFPEIDGLINVYDSLSAQGLITNIKLNVTFYNEYDTFLSLGNETIFYAPGQNETQNIQMDKDLTYPPTQVPLRMGVANLSNVTVKGEGETSDSVLVTDVSGSMDTCGIEGEEEVTYCSYEYEYWYWWRYTECEYAGSCSGDECDTGYDETKNHEVYTTNETVCKASFLDIAKNASKTYIDHILDDSLFHRIGLVNYSTDGNSFRELTNTREVLKDEIEDYEAEGGTCTCCAINRGRMQVEDSDNLRFIILMSDGEPNYYCDSTDDTTGSHDTSLAETTALEAAERVCDENITLFTVGFGDEMSDDGQELMKELACNESDYYDATNVTELAEIYKQISEKILLKANYSHQTLDVQGNFTNSKLMEDSYIEMEYIPYENYEEHGTVPLDFVSDDFDNCSAEIFIPENIDIKESFVTSFSGNEWTKKLRVNGDYVYDLDTYNTNYSMLGDPFQIQVPAVQLEPGKVNNFTLIVGDEYNNSACSENNSFIYTAFVDIFNASAPYSKVLPEAEGCTWHVENYFGDIMQIDVPSGYSGSKTCNYTNSSAPSYNQNDSYDVAMYDFLSYLDYNNDGRVFTDFDEDHLSINIKTIDRVPYLWGPAVAEVRVWR
ncbi:MAG: vWA domain-containing protein [Candidatus Nanoarchaeia archaeon]